MKRKYYISTKNKNLNIEFLRLGSDIFIKSNLENISIEEIKNTVLIAIDTPSIKDLYLPFRKKILFRLEYKEARSKKNLFYSYLYSLFFDIIFEWDSNLFKNSISFLPFFPPRVGLMHETNNVKELKSIDYFLSNDFTSQKIQSISSVVSNKSYLEWHKLRLKMIFELKNLIPDLKIFGRGFNQIPDKSDALINFKYHIAAENSPSGPSEKLWDPLLCQCIVFYAGSLDLVHPILRNAIIPIDIYDFEYSIKTIKDELESSTIYNGISSSDWEIIKETIIKYYTFENTIENQLNNYP